VCDRQDNDCDGVIDESPCAPCLESVEGCPQLNWSALPAGDYLMGGSRADEQPLIAVRLPRFELSDEVSVTQYQACVRSSFCTEAGVGGDCNAGRADRGEHPINCVSWLQAYDYAYWVGARLPSEAEWEYAARSAGLGSPTPWGGGVVSCDFALLRDETGYGCGLNETTPVRALRHSEGVSAQGLWDVLGNVAEWVEDDYQDHYTEAVSEGRSYCDPGGCAAQGQKVYRGGGWRVSVDEVDNRRRFSGFYQLRSAELGFRVARFGP
jgi:formylglycine-generating enzyme required for sulfatase activity